MPEPPKLDVEAVPTEKPARGRRLKGLWNAKPKVKRPQLPSMQLPSMPKPSMPKFRRGGGGGSDTVDDDSGRGGGGAMVDFPTPKSASASVDVHETRRNEQIDKHAKAIEEWNADLKYKRQEAEAHGLEFDDSEFRPRPTTPPGAVDRTNGSFVPPQESGPGGFRGPALAAPVRPEGQRAGAVAELFAAKAYGVSPAAIPGSTAPRDFAAGQPLLPASARSQAPAAGAPAAARPGPALYQSAPPPPLAPSAGGSLDGFTAAGGYGMPGAPAPHAHAAGSLVQSQTYIEPGLADRIRRGRELERLGIAGEEGGNLGHAQAAYMKALELLIPAISGLEHGPDVSYAFRAAEKRKLQNEAELMLGRCEELKRFLALNSAAVPSERPKLMSQMRRERPTSGGTGGQQPLAPPSPGLLDGFSSLGFGTDVGAPDPIAQQGYPRPPAPMPAALPPGAFHGNTAPPVSGSQRAEMLSRPPPAAPGGAATTVRPPPPAPAAVRPSPPPPPPPAAPSAATMMRPSPTPPAPPAARAPMAPTPLPAPAAALAPQRMHHIAPLPPTLPETPPMLRDDAAGRQFEDATARKCDVCRKEDATLAGPCSHAFCASHGNRSAALGWCLEPDCSQRLSAADMRHVLH